MKILGIIMMMVGMSLPIYAVADKTSCALFSSAIELLADSQNRSADFASEGKVSLMCIEHDESRRELENARDIYEQCMPYLRSLGTLESKQVIQVYNKAMAEIESGIMEFETKIETYCAGRKTCTGGAQTLKDGIEYQVHQAEQARKAGNTLLACFILNNVLESAAGELSERYANECMVQDSLDSVRKLRATMPNC